MIQMSGFEVTVTDRKIQSNVSMPIRLGTRTDINDFLGAAAVRDLLTEEEIDQILHEDKLFSRKNAHKRFDIKKFEVVQCSDPKIGAMFR